MESVSERLRLRSTGKRLAGEGRHLGHGVLLGESARDGVGMNGPSVAASEGRPKEGRTGLVSDSKPATAKPSRNPQPNAAASGAAAPANGMWSAMSSRRPPRRPSHGQPGSRSRRRLAARVGLFRHVPVVGQCVGDDQDPAAGRWAAIQALTARLQAEAVGAHKRAKCRVQPIQLVEIVCPSSRQTSGPVPAVCAGDGTKGR